MHKLITVVAAVTVVVDLQCPLLAACQ